MQKIGGVRCSAVGRWVGDGDEFSRAGEVGRTSG